MSSLKGKFFYKRKTKQKLLENYFIDFKKNIYSLFEISCDVLIVFHIPKELNIKLEYFYYENTFNFFIKK